MDAPMVVIDRFTDPMEDALGRESLADGYVIRVHWAPVKCGQTPVFSPILLHGNVHNDTAESRGLLNCRLTGLFTPYASDEKCLGRFCTPVAPKVATRVDLNFQAPVGLDG